jgi:outer membrane protein TolC
MPLRTALAVLVIAATPALSAAQNALTLDQAVVEALAHNRTLAGARAGADQADAGVDVARAAYFPRVSFVESWQRGDQPVFVFGALLSARRFAADNFAIDALNHPAPTGYFHGMFSVEQTIFDAGRTRAAVRAAAGSLDMARAGVEEARADLVVRVTSTFGRLLAADSARQAALSAIEAAREDLTRAEQKRDAGVLSDADVLSLAVHLADVQQRAVRAAGDAAVARAELNRLLGAPVTREVAAAEPMPAEVAAAGRDVPALLAAAELARPEIRRSAGALAVAEAAQSQARSTLWPQLVARGAYQVDGIRVSDRASAWIVGGELQWNWSTGGGQLAAARAAAHGAARARADLDDLRAAVHVDVVSALRRLEAARASEAFARAAVSQARESERITRNRYDAGLAGVADVLRASTMSLDAEARRISAVVDRLQAGAALARALGDDPMPAR